MLGDFQFQMYLAISCIFGEAGHQCFGITNVVSNVIIIATKNGTGFHAQGTEDSLKFRILI